MSFKCPVFINKRTVPPHLSSQPPSYLTIGGLVFTVLTKPFMDEYISDGNVYTPRTEAEIRLLYLDQCNLKDRGKE